MKSVKCYSLFLIGLLLIGGSIISRARANNKDIALKKAQTKLDTRAVKAKSDVKIAEDELNKLTGTKQPRGANVHFVV